MGNNRLPRPANLDHLAPARPVLGYPPDFSERGLPPYDPGRVGSSAEDLESYTVHMYDSRSERNALGGEVPERTIQVTGNHVYCAELTGNRPMYIRLGSKTNPFIRLEEGAAYSRYFRSITFGMSIVPGGTDASKYGRALCYASHGPLILQKPARSYGLRHPVPLSGIATTFWQSIVASPLIRSTTGKRAGSVCLFNGSLSTMLWVNWALRDGTQPYLVPIDGFPILPQQHAVFPFDQSIEEPVNAFCVAVAAGTARWHAFLSNWEQDMFDIEQLSPRGLS